MQRARALDDSSQSVPGRGADASAPRPTPLTLVAGAVAGDDLPSVATTVAHALDCPVAIAIPALGEPVIRPEGSLSSGDAAAIAAYATAVADGHAGPAPPLIVAAVSVRIGEQLVGIVAAATPAVGSPAVDTPAVGSPAVATPAAGAPAQTSSAARASSLGEPAPERHAWLEAAAAAASVTALITEAHAAGAHGPGEVLLAELAAGPVEDLPALLHRARRLGLDLSAGASAISARPRVSPNADDRGADADAARSRLITELRTGVLGTAVIAELRAGRVLAVAPITGEAPELAATLAHCLREAGLTVAVSAPRRDPALLHEALREAELLAELGGALEPQPAGQDETYRLLIGVLLRDRSELRQLRDTTITPLAEYDDRHDTDLVATLRTFLAHDGSTTETAEAMSLHRHTVGYRLSRVHEVSGLSPYESDGRERLSLGIKAQQILDAERRLRDASLSRSG
ncbi:MAG TPA: helix-turn-helix domain-containing protein [Solirubrobacteraceae bacterium]